ncbi:hypothetical protein HDV06_000746 [Boothiomyces sp. JEL0866]|nr:hypothetical protein HDV06_000746 [Boothiomyces sp. JEL0866]
MDIAMIEVTKLEYASESTTYFGTYLPTHAAYLEKKDFDHINKQLNKAKWKKTPRFLLQISKFLKIFFLVIVIGGPFVITKVDFPIAQWLLWLVYAALIVLMIMSFKIGSGDRRRVKEYVKQTCAELSTELGRKGIVVQPNEGIKEIIIYYSPELAPVNTVITINPEPSSSSPIHMDNLKKAPEENPPAYSFN